MGGLFAGRWFAKLLRDTEMGGSVAGRLMLWLIFRKGGILAGRWGGSVAGRWVAKLQGRGWLSCLSHAYTYAHTCTQATCSFYLHNYTPTRITVDCDELCQNLSSHYTLEASTKTTRKKNVLKLKFAPPLLVSHHNQNGYLLSLSFSFPSVAGKDFAYIS